MSNELPTSFPHTPPSNYRYERVRKTSTTDAIWIVSNHRFLYSGASARSIWGFYNHRKDQYFSPINSKRVGETVDVSTTSPWTAMPLLKLALDSTD